MSLFHQEHFIQELCCHSFATASTSRPYSSLRTSSCSLVWDPESTKSAAQHSRRPHATPVPSIGIQKSDREHIKEKRALETKEQTAKRRKSDRERVHAWSILLRYVCTCIINTATICMYRHGQYCCYNMYLHGMVHIQDYQGVSHRLPNHYTCSLH